MDVAKVIADAEAELAKIERELAAMRPLLERKKVLEGMLFHARKLVTAGVLSPAKKAAATKAARQKAAAKVVSQAERAQTVEPDEAKLWEGIRSVISQVGYPMK